MLAFIRSRDGICEMDRTAAIEFRVSLSYSDSHSDPHPIIRVFFFLQNNKGFL